jgi:hypothetical protein
MDACCEQGGAEIYQELRLQDALPGSQRCDTSRRGDSNGIRAEISERADEVPGPMDADAVAKKSYLDAQMVRKETITAL